MRLQRRGQFGILEMMRQRAAVMAPVGAEHEQKALVLRAGGLQRGLDDRHGGEESEEGGQLYDLPQLKDFGLTKTPGHCHHRHLYSNESSIYFKLCPNYCNV